MYRKNIATKDMTNKRLSSLFRSNWRQNTRGKWQKKEVKELLPGKQIIFKCSIALFSRFKTISSLYSFSLSSYPHSLTLFPSVPLAVYLPIYYYTVIPWVPYYLVLPDVYTTYITNPQQAFLVRNLAWHSVGLKTRRVKIWRDPFIRSTAIQERRGELEMP